MVLAHRFWPKFSEGDGYEMAEMKAGKEKRKNREKRKSEGIIHYLL